MAKFPRLLIASVPPAHEPTLCTLGLLAAFKSRGFHVQHFRSLCAFTPLDFVTPVTGIASRHIDPWVMSPALCRELFVHSADKADLSVIEGCSPCSAGHAGFTGWPAIAQLLDCPVVGVVPCQPQGEFHAPPLPAPLDALFLEQFSSREQFNAQKAALEEIYRKPVIGGLAAGGAATDLIERVRCGRSVPGSVVDEFARRIIDSTDLKKLLALARSRTFAAPSPELFRQRATRQTMRVAVAYDDCFHCYFPETLEALEFLGAEICEFSPLTDERLPEATDVVLLGCGHPENYSSALAENECMRAALRQHVCAGQRVYAEGGGAAYLCQHLRTVGARFPMVGIFPAEAEFTGSPLPRPQPMEVVCQRATWIAGPGETVRGYRTGAWRFHPTGDCPPAFTSELNTHEILVRHHCIGSTIHVNFAAQPRVLEALLATHAPSLSL